MGAVVIVTYEPKPGRLEELKELLQIHVPLLQQEKLATSRSPYIMMSAEGRIIEIFEWISEETMHAAHENPTVLALWEKFNEVCHFSNLASLNESKAPFAHFEPVVF